MDKLSYLLLLVFTSTILNAQSEIPYQNMVDAAAYAENTGGAAMLVMQNGNIIFEDFHNGADSNTVTHLFSATKGFWSLLAVHALETGLIQSYDERVSQTITEWQDTAAHPFKHLITIRHLLQLSSGLSQDVDQIQGLDAGADNIYQYTVDSLDLIFVPGSNFQYGPSNYYAFGVLMKRKLQQAGIMLDPLEYLDSVIFQPIGLQYDSWAHDKAGNPHIPNGSYMLPREFIKFGQLLLQKGSWAGEQVVDSALVEDLFLADGPNPGHGKFLWLNKQEGYGAYPFMSAPPGSTGGFMYHHGYNDIIGALGAGKNRMYIIPSLQAVVVRQTQGDEDDFLDHTFLEYLLANVTSIEEPKSEIALSLFPNPATRELHLKLGPLHSWEAIEIIDVNGKCLLRQALDAVSPIALIPVSELPAGLYFARLLGKKNTKTLQWLKK